MRPRPKHKREIDFPNLDYGQDMDALISFILSRWDGIKNLKPKGYKKFCKNYTDYKGMDDPSLEKDKKEFDSFDDSGVCCFSFPIKTSLPHVAYDDICQGRPPYYILFGALVAHGHARGELFGAYNALDRLRSRLSYVMICKLIKKYKRKASAETTDVLQDFANEVIKFLDEARDGKHASLCECRLCKIPRRKLSEKKKAILRQKIENAMNKRSLRFYNGT